MLLINLKNLPEYMAPAPFTRSAKILVDPITIPETPLTIGYFKYDPGQVGPRHIHNNEVEIYYCLSGTGVVIIEEEQFILEQGSALYIPPKHFHETKNIGNVPFEFLGIFGPAVELKDIRRWECVSINDEK
jgi:mannose-6-phosphate isomerase-like protein (cupin superfamily)